VNARTTPKKKKKNSDRLFHATLRPAIECLASFRAIIGPASEPDNSNEEGAVEGNDGRWARISAVEEGSFENSSDCTRQPEDRLRGRTFPHLGVGANTEKVSLERNQDINFSQVPWQKKKTSGQWSQWQRENAQNISAGLETRKFGQGPPPGRQFGVDGEGQFGGGVGATRAWQRPAVAARM